MLSRDSSTLLSLLGHISRVSADVCSLSSCFTAAVHHLVVGEAGEHTQLDLLLTQLIICRLENIMCAAAMGVVGIWCMHFIGYACRKVHLL
jgi:NO-binding membrane sensor protein with MHYT domain